jgi:thioredoxin 2
MQLVCPSCAAKNRVPDARLYDGPVCGCCGHALMDAKPVALDEQSFDRFIQGTELPVLVDCWADWCGPCKAMAPQFEAAAAKLADVRFVKLDTEAAPNLSARLGIRSIPTMVLFQGGKEIARQSGAMPAATIVDWVRRSQLA